MSPSMEYWITYPRECHILCLFFYSKSNPVIDRPKLRLETGRHLCWNKVKYIYFMSFERDELDGKYSLIGCRNTCVLLCMLLSCLVQALECCLHCMSLPVIGQGMPVFKWLAVNRWSLLATFRGGKQVCFSFC